MEKKLYYAPQIVGNLFKKFKRKCEKKYEKKVKIKKSLN